MGDRVGLVVVKVGNNDGPDGARVAIIVGDFVWIPVGIKVVRLNVGLTDWDLVGILVGSSVCIGITEGVGTFEDIVDGADDTGCEVGTALVKDVGIAVVFSDL